MACNRSDRHVILALGWTELMGLTAVSLHKRSIHMKRSAVYPQTLLGDLGQLP